MRLNPFAQSAAARPAQAEALASRKEVIALRVSIARLAQTLGVDSELRVTGRSYHQLHGIAASEERGWNRLVARCMLAIEKDRDLHTKEMGFVTHQRPAVPHLQLTRRHTDTQALPARPQHNLLTHTQVDEHV